MNKKPLVSIIMPVYNCESFIKKAMDSILSQTYPYFELLIADDGSIDKSRKIIDSYNDKRISTFHNSINIGNIRTRNKLFSLAKGELITIQDGDDWSEINRIEKQVEAFLRDEELGACGTNYYRVIINGDMHVNTSLTADIKETNSHKLNMCPATIMIKKSVYTEIGGLNLYFDKLFAEDRYWIYLITEKFKTLCLATPLYYYRQNPASLTNSIENIRKLVITTVVDKLIAQRVAIGTDWLEQEEFEKIKMFEEDLLKNRKWLSSKYQIYAAVGIDNKDYRTASRFLIKSIQLDSFSLSQLRTVVYFIRSYLKQSIIFCKS